MLVTAGSVPERVTCAGCQTHETGRLFVAWTGLLYLCGNRAGVESIAPLATALEREPLTALCRSLHGIFVLFVYDRQEQVWQVAVDNAGLYHAYHDDHMVGTNFLELIRAGAGEPAIAPAAAAEFLAHDGVFWSKTLIEGISRIGHDEVVELPAVAVPDQPAKTILRKELAPPGSVDEAAFFDHHAHLATALQDLRVSVDLTGGFDSRLLACILARFGLEFETAIVGRPGLPDVTIAAKVARALGKAFHVTVHDPTAIEAELPELFEQCDGLGDVLSYHRSRQLSKDRRGRGVEVVLAGAGGELYKDFWWLQDWPFYNSRKVNFARLYDLRVRPIGLPDGLLTGEAAAAYADLRRQTVEGFERYRGPTNTESYDNVYFFYKMSQFAGRFATSNINHHVMTGAPFLDYDNFIFGKSLSKARRFLNRFHRENITAYCPDLAGLETTEGVTARSGLRHTAANLVGFGYNRSRRLVKKIGEQILGRRWLQQADPNAPELVGRARNTAIFCQAVADLKDAGLVNPDLPIEAIRDADVGRLLTLGMLTRHVGSCRRRP